MATGKVKWFNSAKGFGYITSDNDGENLFAHMSRINTNNFRNLREDQEVTFDVVEGPNGNYAGNIAWTEAPPEIPMAIVDEMEIVDNTNDQQL